jgi:hypothetical protein
MINNGAHISGSANDIPWTDPATIDNTISRSERKKYGRRNEPVGRLPQEKYHLPFL